MEYRDIAFRDATIDELNMVSSVWYLDYIHFGPAIDKSKSSDDNESMDCGVTVVILCLTHNVMIEHRNNTSPPPLTLQW